MAAKVPTFSITSQATKSTKPAVELAASTKFTMPTEGSTTSSTSGLPGTKGKEATPSAQPSVFQPQQSKNGNQPTSQFGKANGPAGPASNVASSAGAIGAGYLNNGLSDIANRFSGVGYHGAGSDLDFVGIGELLNSDMIADVMATSGIASQRPEIIMSLDFQPTALREQDNLVQTAVGKLLDVQLESRKLRSQNVTSLLGTLSTDDSTKAEYTSLVDEYKNKIDTAKNDLNVLLETQQVLSYLEDSFKIRDNVSLITTNIVSNSSAVKARTGVNTKTILEFMMNDLGFSKETIMGFSNTKIINQIVLDLVNTLRLGFGPTHVDESDIVSDSGEGFSTGDEETNPTSGANSAYKLRDFKAAAAALGNSFAKLTDFKYVTALPTDALMVPQTFQHFSDLVSKFNSPSKELSVLLTWFSREMRISAALSRPNIRAIFNDTFGLSAGQNNEGVDIENLFGVPNMSIINAPMIANGSKNVLSTFSYTRLDDNNVVLPFEEQYIEIQQKNFIPGNQFYIDGIINANAEGVVKVDTSRIQAYANGSNTAIDAIRTIFDSCFTFDDTETAAAQYTKPEGILATLVDFMINATPSYESARSMTTDADTFGYIAEMSLFRMAEQDVVLRGLLFQLSLLTSKLYRAGTQQANFFNDLVFKSVDSGEAEQVQTVFFGDVGSSGRDTNAGSPVNYTPETLTQAQQDAQAARDAAAAVAAATAAEQAAFEAKLSQPSVKEIVITLNAIAAQIAGARVTIDAYNATGLINDITGFRETVPFYTVPYIGYFGPSGPNQTDISDVYKRILERILAGRSLFNVVVETIGHVNWATDSSSFIGSISRLSGLSKTTMLYLLFESFFTLVQKVSSATLIKIGASELTQESYKIQIGVSTDLDTLTNIQQSVFSRHVDDNVIVGQSINQNVKTFVSNIKHRLIEDDMFIDNAFNTLRILFKNVYKSANAAIEKINLAQPKAILNKLGAFASVASLPQQLILSRNALSNLDASFGTVSNIMPAIQSPQQAQTVSPFLDDSYVDDSMASLLHKLLSEQRFNTANNGIKILSVGLPSGFMKHLSSKRISTNEFMTGAPNLTPTSQKDIIIVNVYKRDYEYDAIIFKPQKFFFEMTRVFSRYATSDVGQLNQIQEQIQGLSQLPADDHYVPGGSIGVDRFGRVIPGASAASAASSQNNVSNIDSLINTFDTSRILTINYDSKLNSKFESLTDIKDNAEYSFLSEQEKESLLKNHVISYLLSLYVRLLTGVSLSEDSFIMGFDDRQFDIDATSKKFFDDLIKAHIIGVVGRGNAQQSSFLQNMVDRLKNASNSQSVDTLLEQLATTIPDITSGAKIELSQDLLSFLSIFSPKSIFGGGTVHSSRILAPKLFERIFNIVVDENDFEIDLAKTIQSPNNPSGMTMYDTVKSLNNNNYDGMTMIKELKTNGTVTSSRLIKPAGDNISLVEYFVTIETANNRVD